MVVTWFWLHLSVFKALKEKFDNISKRLTFTAPMARFTTTQALLVFIAFTQVLSLKNTDQTICPDQLAGYIDQILAQPQYVRSLWGISIKAQNNNTNDYRTLYNLNERRFFVPASNNKVITTSAAFLTYPPNYQYSTNIYGTSDQQTFCLKAVGDPSITYEQINSAIASLRNDFGIDSFSTFIVDTSNFTGTPFPGTWEFGDLSAHYGSQPTSVIVNENNVAFSVLPTQIGKPASIQFEEPSESFSSFPIINRVITGNSTSINYYYDMGIPSMIVEGTISSKASPQSFNVAVQSPEQHFVDVVQYYLQANQIEHKNASLGRCEINNSWKVYSSIVSQEISTLMNYTLQESDNLYAECFQLLLGASQPAPPADSTRDVGIDRVKDILHKEFDIDVNGFFQVDGSGLSRQNLVSPDTLVNIFIQMSQQPNGKLYQSFLPVAGESGTLANRFVGTSAQGIVEAKTGTLTGVSALSGYAQPPAYDNIIFSIIVNNSEQSATVRQEGIDSIVLLLTQLTQC